jgi:hypothetical protein
MKTNYENKNESEINGIMNDTNKISLKEECEGIGKRKKLPFEVVDGKKVWYKYCKCGVKQTYTSNSAISFAIKHNKCCISCKNTGDKNPFFNKHHSEIHKNLLSVKQKRSGSYRYKNAGGNPPKIEKVCVLCHTIYFVTKSRVNSKYCCYKCAIKDNFGFEFGKMTYPELIFKKFLVEHDILYEYNFEFKGSFFDFFIPQKNLLVEIDGIYWHGKNLKDDELDHIQTKVRKKDKIKNRLAEESGYTLIRIWEDDVENVQKYLY